MELINANLSGAQEAELRAVFGGDKE